MVIQIVPLDSSKPNVIELECVHVAFVIASDSEHGVYLQGVYVCGMSRLMSCSGHDGVVAD
jgi:hypothetical protein